MRALSFEEARAISGDYCLCPAQENGFEIGWVACPESNCERPDHPPHHDWAMDQQTKLEHIQGAAQVSVALRLGLQCLRDAHSGYLALASDEETKLWMPSAKPVFDAISEAVSAGVRAEHLLEKHEQAIKT